MPQIVELCFWPSGRILGSAGFFFSTTNWPRKKIHVPKESFHGWGYWGAVRFSHSDIHIQLSQILRLEITESIECRQGSPNHALIFLPLTLSPAINILQRDLSWQFRWLIYQVAKSPASFLWVSIRSCRANRKEIMSVFFPPSAMLADETWK